MVRARFAGVVLAVAAVGGAACSSTSGEATGSQAAAVAQGAQDTGETYKFVGGLQKSPGGSPICSAFLVSPTYAITANHCITNNPSLPSGLAGTQVTSLRISFAYDPTSVTSTSDLRLATHTYPSSGAVQVRFLDIQGPNGNDAAHDVAVIKLDTPVSQLAVTPVAIGGIGNTPQCESSIQDAYLVGYGGTNLIGDTTSGFRTFSFTHDWDRHTADPTFSDCLSGPPDYDPGNFTFVDSWGPGGLGYSGALKGDSGGALLQSLNGGLQVCGVTSRYGAEPCHFLDVFSESAGTDSGENAAFIGNIILDSQKRLKGYCYGPAVDQDNDGVYDSCDNCPNVYNPGQYDQDGDGWGDVCDNCNDVANPGTSKLFDPDTPHQADVNFDGEERALGAGVRVPPTNPPPSSTYLTDNFPGDRCDPNPVTVMSSTGVDYPGSRKIPCTIHFTGAHCPPNIPDVTTTCGLAHGNGIHASEIVAKSSTAYGVTRTMACSCPMTDLDLCGDGFGCTRGSGGLDYGGGWVRMTMDDPSNGNQITLAYKTASTGYLDTMHERIDTGSANDQSWGWAYWKDFGLGPAQPTSHATVLSGFMWSWVRTYGYSKPYPKTSETPTGPESSQWRRQVVAPVDVFEDGVSDVTVDCVPKPIKAINLVNLQSCPMCGGNSALLIPTESSDPWNVVSAGLADLDATSLLDGAVKQALMDENSLVLLANDVNWTAGGVQGAIVDRLSHSVVYPLNALPDGHVTLAGGPAGDPPAGAPAPPELVTMSGRRQQVAFFDQQDDSGNYVAKTYDFETASYATRHYLGRDGLVDPAAVAYRPEDDDYYVRLPRRIRGLT